MRRLSKLAIYFVSVFTAVLLVLLGLFGQRCATVPISSVAFRPDGQEMLVVKQDGQVERWGGWPERAEYLYTTGHTGYIGSIAFSPDGKLIASISEDTSVRLWDAHTGMLIRTFYGITDKTTTNLSSQFLNVRFTANSQILCGRSHDRFVLWNVDNATVLGTYSTVKATILCSPDEQTIIVHGYGRIQVTDIQTKRVLQTFDSPQTREGFICTPDGKSFLTIGNEGWRMRIRDFNTGNVSDTFSIKEKSGWGAFTGYAPDCLTAIYIDRNELQIRETISGRVLLYIKLNEVIASASYAPDGKSFGVITDSAVYQIDSRTGKQSKRLTASDYPIGIGIKIANLFGIAVSPSGTRVAASSSDKRIWIWDAQSGELLHRSSGHTASVRSATYTLDGKGLLTTGDDHVAFLWDLQTGKPIRMFEPNWYLNMSMRVPTNGKVATTLDIRGPNRLSTEVNLWDISTGKLVRTFSAVGQIVGSALSPDGSYLATVTKDGIFWLWEISLGKAIVSWPLTNRPELYSDQVLVEISPDGKLISIAGKGAIRVIEDGTFIKFEHDLPEIYSTQVTGLEFSPDGSTLAATFAGTGNQIYLWDTEGKLLKRMSHPGAHLTSLAFSPDGKTILTGSADGIPRLWDVETGTPQRVLCPNIISRRYSAGGWIGLLALIIVPLRVFRRYRTDSLKTPVV
jgi:WD40 repeat protein